MPRLMCQGGLAELTFVSQGVRRRMGYMRQFSVIHILRGQGAATHVL